MNFKKTSSRVFIKNSAAIKAPIKATKINSEDRDNY